MMHVDESMLMEVPAWDVPSPPPGAGGPSPGSTPPGATLSTKKAKKAKKGEKRAREGEVAQATPQPPLGEPGGAPGSGGKKNKKSKLKRQALGDGPGGSDPGPKGAGGRGSKPTPKPADGAARGGGGQGAGPSHAGGGGPNLQVKKVSKAAKGGRGLLDKMRARLSGGRFRWLNEELYTQPGEESFASMQADPSMFEEYHAGFREQTADWPQQPVELCIEWLKGRPRSLVVADFGCGDAQLMDSVPNTVHSLDLVSQRDGVVACNLADVPLADRSVDVVVFCLALMGTDYPRFLEEAVRVLRPGGTVWIAEVRSRFTDPPGKEATLLTKALRTLGLVLKRRDSGNKMFIILELELAKKPQQGAQWPQLKACIYKRR